MDSLLSVAVRPLVRGRLALLLSDLQQVNPCPHVCWGAGNGVGGRTRFAILGPLGSLHKSLLQGIRPEGTCSMRLRTCSRVCGPARAPFPYHQRAGGCGRARLSSQRAWRTAFSEAWVLLAALGDAVIHQEAYGKRSRLASRSLSHASNFNLVPGPRVAAGNGALQLKFYSPCLSDVLTSL